MLSPRLILLASGPMTKILQRFNAATQRNAEFNVLIRRYHGLRLASFIVAFLFIDHNIYTSDAAVFATTLSALESPAGFRILVLITLGDGILLLNSVVGEEANLAEPLKTLYHSSSPLDRFSCLLWLLFEIVAIATFFYMLVFIAVNMWRPDARRLRNSEFIDALLSPFLPWSNGAHPWDCRVVIA